MKVQLLPSTFEADGTASQRQHLACLIVDDKVAFDAGSLALACTDEQRANVRDVVISHVHLDHIAGLPMFIDDLYSTLDAPVRIHVTEEMAEALERDIFNWTIYPRFSELKNAKGSVLEYKMFDQENRFTAAHLSVLPFAVNHSVQSYGFLVEASGTSIAITGDMAHTPDIWTILNESRNLSAIFIECAFPNELSDIAETSHHMTPARLAVELEQFERTDVPIYALNIKPMFRDTILAQIMDLAIDNLTVMEIGKVYDL